MAETTGTNDDSIFAPRGLKYTDTTADAGVALRGQTVADTPAQSGNTTNEPGNAKAAADAGVALRGQTVADTPAQSGNTTNEPGNAKAAADAGVALRGQTVADTPAQSGNTTNEPGNAKAAADVTGTSKAYVIVYAPDNQGEININAVANTVLTGRANATAPDGGATGQAGNAEALVNLNGESDAQIILYAPNNRGIINREAVANTILTGQADADASGNGLALSQVDALLASQTGEHALHGNQGSSAIADSVWFG